MTEPDALMRATVWTCGECGGSALRNEWDIQSALLLGRIRMQIERGEIDPDDVWIDDEVAVCPRCKFEHHDDDCTWIEESFVQLPPMPGPTDDEPKGSGDE